MERKDLDKNEFKEALWNFIFWPYIFFHQYFWGKREKGETESERLWNFFYWGRLLPLKKYFLNRNRASIKVKYPDLTPEQIDFIAGWSLTAPWVPLIWSLKNKLKNISIVFALNYLLIGLSPVVYIVWQDSNSWLEVISFFLIAIVLYLTLTARIYFIFNAKRLSWQQNQLNFDEFKSQQDKLDKKIWWSIVIILGLILILLLGFLLSS